MMRILKVCLYDPLYVFKSMTEGYIYIINSSSFEVNTFKLGYTEFSKKRLEQRYNTYNPKGIKIHGYYYVKNKRLGESLLFHFLRNYRLHPKHEFFQCELKLIQTKCEEVVEIVNSEILKFNEQESHNVLHNQKLNHANNELDEKKSSDHDEIETNLLDELSELQKTLNMGKKYRDLKNGIENNESLINKKNSKKFLLFNLDKIIEGKITMISPKKLYEKDPLLEIISNDAKKIMEDIFSNGISKLLCANLYFILNMNFNLYDTTNNEWYLMNEYGLYIKNNNSSNLKNTIRLDIEDVLKQQYEILSKKMVSKEESNRLLATHRDHMKFLTNYRIFNNIISKLEVMFEQYQQNENLDNVNPYVIGFDNGVYDLKEDIFRNALPNEYISMTTGYQFTKVENKYIDELEKIFIEIFPGISERKYILKTLSLSLIGTKLLDEVYIWSGSGDNGKDFMQNLLFSTLGNYFSPMDIEYFTKNAHGVHAKAPDPIMADKRNKRFVITNNASETVHLRYKKLNKLFCTKPVSVKPLYKESFDFVPKFNLIIQCNNKITIDMETASDNKIRIINFATKYNDHTLAGEGKIDDNYKLAFFMILKKYYNEFMANDYQDGKGKLEMPERIKKDTEDYLTENDPIQAFLDEMITKTDDHRDFVSSSKLYKSFLSHCNNKTLGYTTIKFKSAMLKKGFNYKKTNKGRGYTNITINENEEDTDFAE